MKTPSFLSLGLALGLLATGAPARTDDAKPAPRKAAFLGVSAVPVDEALRHHLKLPRGAGLTVQEVTPASPAATAGIKNYDVLERLNDQILFNSSQFRALVRSFDPGQSVTVKLWREGETKSVEAKLGETEANEPEGAEGFLLGLDRGAKIVLSDASGPGGEVRVLRVDPKDGFGQAQVEIEHAIRESLHGLGKDSVKTGGYLGVQLQPVEASLAAQLDLEAHTGALVGNVMDDSPAAAAGLRENDIIVSLDGDSVAGPEELAQAIRKHKKGDTVTLNVLRGGKKTEVKATLDERSTPDIGAICDVFQGPVDPTPDSTTGPGLQKRIERMIIRGTGTEPSPGVRTVTKQQSIVVIRSDEGTTTVEKKDGHTHVKIEGPDGKVAFDGPADTEAEKARLPVKVRMQLDRIRETQPAPPAKPVQPMKLKAPVHSDKDLVKLPRNHASQTKPIVDLQPAGTEL